MTATPSEPPYSSLLVCREILHKGKERNIANISQLKLIKLAYIAHGFHLAYLNKPLFSEKVAVWPWGCMVKAIYDQVNHYGKKPIYHRQFDHIEGRVKGESEEVIELVMAVYGEYHAITLSALTHQENSPWHIAKNKWRRKDIPDLL